MTFPLFLCSAFPAGERRRNKFRCTTHPAAALAEAVPFGRHDGRRRGAAALRRFMTRGDSALPLPSEGVVATSTRGSSNKARG